MQTPTNLSPVKDSPVKDRTEEQLLAEIDDLKRKLREQHRDAHHGGTHGHPKRPSSTTLWMLGIGVLVIIVVAFFAGYLPETSRQTALAKEAQADAAELPPVNITLVEHASGKSMLLLPGNIQAVTEAPVLARASGYIKQRYADIGDRVKQGQLLAEIDAAEVDKQVDQAKATVEQAKSSLDQANSNLSQSKTNAEMARVTFSGGTRWWRKGRFRVRMPIPTSRRRRRSARTCSRCKTRWKLGKATLPWRRRIWIG
jgi:biotin/lipoyl-binding protein